MRLRSLAFLAVIPTVLGVLLLGSGYRQALDEEPALVSERPALHLRMRIETQIEQFARAVRMMTRSAAAESLREAGREDAEHLMRSVAWQDSLRDQLVPLMEVHPLARRVDVLTVGGQRERVTGIERSDRADAPLELVPVTQSIDPAIPGILSSDGSLYRISPLSIQEREDSTVVRMRVSAILRDAWGEACVLVVFLLDLEPLVQSLHLGLDPDQELWLAEASVDRLVSWRDTARGGAPTVLEPNRQELLAAPRPYDASIVLRDSLPTGEAAHLEALRAPGSGRPVIGYVGLRGPSRAPGRGRFVGVWFRAVLGAGILGVLAIAYQVVQRARRTRRLRQISEAAGGTGGGSALAGLAVGRADEIGQVARSLVDLEARLRRKQLQIEEVLRTAAVAIITADRRGSILSFNSAATEIFGWAAAEVIGKNLSLLVNRSEAPLHDGYLKRYLDGGVPRVMGRRRVVTARSRSGEEFPVELSLSHLEFDGVSTFTGVVRDLRKEARLTSTIRELEERNLELDAFAYATSHDIRAPLRTGVGLVTSAREELALGHVEEVGTQILPMLETQFERLERLVSDILEVSRSKHEAVPAVLVDPTDLCQEVQRQLAGLAGFDEVEMRIRSTVQRARFEGGRLLRVLLNLVSNAIKFRDHDKLTCRIDIEFDAKGEGELQVRVRDNGIGIQEKYYGEVFQMFTRATNRAWGSGLGLYLVRKEVERMDGAIDYETSPDGTTFTVCFPVVHMEARVEERIA